MYCGDVVLVTAERANGTNTEVLSRRLRRGRDGGYIQLFVGFVVAYKPRCVEHKPLIYLKI